MDLRYCLPRRDLRDYVRAYYYFYADAPAAQPLCAELGNIRITLSGDGRNLLPGGASEFHRTALIGPTSAAYRIEVDADTRVFGIGVMPQGWAQLFGVSAQQAADRSFDLTALAGRRAREAIDEIENAADLTDMAAAADRFFTELLIKRAPRELRYPKALEQWVLDPADLNLDALMEMMDVSRRQTDRLAKQFFGASPKLLQRKYRTLRAAQRIRAGERRWIMAAGDGFYDQAHFIREFRTFIGMTPLEYAANQAALAAQAPARRAAALRRSAVAGL